MRLPKNGISSHLSAISTPVMCPHLSSHACLHLLRASHVLIAFVQREACISTLYNVHCHALLRYSTLLRLTMVEPPSGSAVDGWFSCSDAVGITGSMSIQHVILVSLSAYVRYM